MKLAQSVKMGAWLLVLMNLLVAFGSIRTFMRMAPAIEVIIAQNAVSLEAAEQMLAALAQREFVDHSNDGIIESFRSAMDRAKNNATEKDESAVIETISLYYVEAFNGDDLSLGETVSAIRELGNINRSAMRRADLKARQMGYAGAWGVVFMATTAFVIGMLFLRSLRKNLSEPMEEIDLVVTAFREGDPMRRCTIGNPSRSVKKIFENINELLDMHSPPRNPDER